MNDSARPSVERAVTSTSAELRWLRFGGWAIGKRTELWRMVHAMMDDTLERRNKLLRQRLRHLPGSIPYLNCRPINVPSRCEGQTLLDCLCTLHPHISPRQWRDWFHAGHILRGADPMPTNQIVRGGEQYRHLFPDTVEPDVDAEIEVLWEDESLIAVNKPAPLPVHPSGRYNLNTLTSLLEHAYGSAELKLVHRLDANTTGLMLLARTRHAATHLRHQFERNEIRKKYLVRCGGHPDLDVFTRDDPIAKHRGRAGTREIDRHGHDALTEFRVVRRLDDRTSLLEARPLTGRTNQIRIHLWAMGMPVMGDPAYRPGKQLVSTQTLSVGRPPMCLHASQLSLIHPTSGDSFELAAPAPEWIEAGSDS